MRVHRMTFDIAVENGAPDVYTLESEIRKAIHDGAAFVIGAEAVGKTGLRVNSIEASLLIDRQIKEDQPIDTKPCQILPSHGVNESEAAK